MGNVEEVWWGDDMTRHIGPLALPLIALLLGACATEQPKEAAHQPIPAIANQPRIPVPPPAAQIAKPAAPLIAAPQPVKTVNPFEDPANPLSRRSIYYDFDSSEIRPEFRTLLEAHAKYLRAHPGARIAIQGNCDERGSREYNIALGQQRAEAAMKAMVLFDASERQIESTSNGEEKPRATGHDESSWASNRRSDIVYLRLE
jgi:peptidoglycan-associated lipoprotein